MKRHILPLLALGAVFLTAGSAFGQTPSPASAAGTAAKPQKLVRIATLNTVKDVQEFQNNVQFLQAQRQAAVDLGAKMEKEKDAKKKQEMKTQFDALMLKLNENNAAMNKVYGFSLTRNYTLEIEKANIYMLVTDEEAAKIEQAQKAEAAAKTKK